MYRRVLPEAGGWTGPGAVVMLSETNNTVWVLMMSTLMKCSRERVRRATSEESLGVELAQELLGDLRQEIRTNRRQRGFRDASSEGPPPSYEGDVAELIPEVGVTDDPPMESTAMSRGASGGPHPTVSEPESENRVVSPEFEMPEAFRRRIEQEAESSVASSQRLDGVPQLARVGLGRTSEGNLIHNGHDRPRSPSRVETPERGGGSLTYIAIADFHNCDAQNSDVVWNYRRQLESGKSQRWEPCGGPEIVESSAMSDGFEACFAHQCFYIAPKTRGDELRRRDMAQHDWPQFEASILKEWSGALGANAVTVIPPAEAALIRNKHPERCLTSRVVLRWKKTETRVKAKARWCVHGFKDPDIHNIERSCPTPELTTIHIAMQVMASMQFPATVGDATLAFMQGDPSKRSQPLYTPNRQEMTLGLSLEVSSGWTARCTAWSVVCLAGGRQWPTAS